jgi:hypothetical protein
MKSNQKVTRVKLHIEQYDDYILFGLVTAEPDYKLSIALNKKFGISLKHKSPIIPDVESKPELLFSRFSNGTSGDDLTVDLISNRNGKNHLLNKLKNIDYLLQIQTNENEADKDELITGLREIESITAVFNIDLTTIKDKNLHYLTQ